MPFQLDMGAWRGRVDPAEGELALRWHQAIRALPEAPGEGGVALLGYACDEGVRRNQGRPGAAEGPAALRAHLANLPLRPGLRLFDAGTFRQAFEPMEEAQEAYGKRVAQVMDLGLLPIGLGGGHDLAWGTWRGLADHLAHRGMVPRVGILNLDAHFDLRSAPAATSGTPFLQIAQDCAGRGWAFNYAVLGLSAFANTEALFQRARDLGVRWRLDEDLEDPAAVRAFLEDFLGGLDHLYLTCCLDVLPAAAAPGVSAPSARGVPLHVVEKVIDQACASGKLRAADLAELNPALDEDGRTARVAARLVARIAEATRG